MDRSALALEKAGLRKWAKNLLSATSSDERRSAGIHAAATARSMPHWKNAELVLAFLSMPKEIDTSPLIEAAIAEGKRVGVPRIHDGDIAFVELTSDWREWPRDRWDIPEPPASLAGLSAKAIVSVPTIILVPGLLFDRSGGRLGRGKGYYDRFLTSLSAERLTTSQTPHALATIGYGYESQLVDRVPMDELDSPLDGLALG